MENKKIIHKTDKIKRAIKRRLEFIRKETRMNILLDGELDVSLCETFLPSSISKINDDGIINIQLTEELTDNIVKVQFYDNTNYLGRFVSFPSYKIENNMLMIDLKKIPNVGNLSVLLKTQEKFLILLNNTIDFSISTWKITKGLDSELQIVSQNTKPVQPISEKIFVKNFEINKEGLILDIPEITIDNLIMEDEDGNVVYLNDFIFFNSQLRIGIQNLHLDDGKYYRVFLLRHGIKYRLFSPESLLKSKYNRYYNISGSNNFFYFSEFGYLKLACLNNSQVNKVYKNQSVNVDEVNIIDNQLKLRISGGLDITKQDQIVARRFADMKTFDYISLHGNNALLEPNHDGSNMSYGFDYPLEVLKEINSQIKYLPITTDYLVEIKESSKKVVSERIYITESQNIEQIRWEKLKVIAKFRNDKVVVESESINSSIEYVLAKFKERPVFFDITNGITIDRLSTVFQTIRIIYRKKGELMVTEVAVNDLLNRLYF